MKKLLVLFIALACIFVVFAMCGIISNVPNADDYGVLFSRYSAIFDFTSASNDLSQFQLILWRYRNLPIFLLPEDYPDVWVDENDDGTYTLNVQPQSEIAYPEGFIGPIYRPIERFEFDSFSSCVNALARSLPGSVPALGYENMLTVGHIFELTDIPLVDWITTPTRGVINLLVSGYGLLTSCLGVVFSVLFDAVSAGAVTLHWFINL